MRTTLKRMLLAGSGAALAGLVPGVARAQSDITQVLPNVLLLIDSSGSMEYLIHPGTNGVAEITSESNDSNATGSACTVTTTGIGTPPTTMNKWASLVSVLTGSFQPGAFNCQTVSRSDNAFVTEFGLPGAPQPYDFNYFLPWHRIYSNGCTIGALQPVNANQNWTNWGAQPYDYHTVQGLSANNTANACPNGWTGQNNDGVLDIFAGLARFGMMTIDTLPDPGTGSTLTPATTIVGSTGMKGMWSYYDGWQNAYPPATPAAPVPATPLSADPAITVPAGQVSPTTAIVNSNRPAAGNPNLCSTESYMEVGARNPAAPPWEGPMVPFGNWASDTGIAQTNAQIQLELLSMRPYGATPIAGLIDDANEFLFKDQSTVPGQSGSNALAFGPSGPNPDGTHGDQSWLMGCRKTFMILLTDGMPNLDLRGASGNCDAYPADPANPGRCPYQAPDVMLYNMRAFPPTSNQSVSTYVIGFAMSNPAALAQVNPSYTSCADLQIADCNRTNLPAAVQSCCELQKLALAGAASSDPVFTPGNDPVSSDGYLVTPHAFFADTAGQLKQVLATILTNGIGKKTARTSPVYSIAPSNTTAQGNLPAGGVAKSYHFAASFNVTSSATGGNVAQGGGANGLWSGNLVRERYACNNLGVVGPVTPSNSAGDNFGHNLDKNTVHSRNLWTAIAPTSGNQINSDYTLRPNLTTNDGFGLTNNAPAPPNPPLTAGDAFPTYMSNYPAALGIATSGNDPNCSSNFGIKNQPQNCATYLVNWAVGGVNTALPATSPSRDPASSYCTAIPNRSCSKLGAVYHSTPVVVGPPREFLRDDTYTAYANSAGVATQPYVLYTATMDGQLHAFKVSSTDPADTPYVDTDLTNNELWSFIPPAVLQHLNPNFNTGGANLLDGQVVISDVPGSSAVGALPPVFERTPGSVPNWHRVLLGGGGAAGGFYYALDITLPTKPTFLWQLSTDDAGHPVFGNTTPTPAIGMVAIIENAVRTQVPVAILPGGGGIQATGTCNPPPHAPTTNIKLNDPGNPSNPGGSIYNIANTTAAPLRCWSTNTNPGNGNAYGNFHNGTAATGNSVMIVRLDTGAVLQHFTGLGYSGWIGNGNSGDHGDHAHTSTTQTTMPMTAPMVGSPAVYPAQTGQVTDHVYLGDADGQLWRIDLSDTNPSNWTVTLAWDAYFDSSNTTVRDQAQLAPVVSTDPVGNLVINYATGDQNLLTSQSSDNRLWSLTETPGSHLVSQNWVAKFSPTQGHVTGPMALFNNTLYFSTYDPSSAAACSNGAATVLGVDYRNPQNPPGAIQGAPHYNFTGSSATDGSVIMGVSATQLPSCNSTQSSSDPYYGSHTQVTSANQSVYKIMWQTGAGSGLSGGGVQNENGITGMQNMVLPAPGQSTRIDSWATIVE